jgi:polyhydroxyalkanoate synthesis regulator phasin
MEIQLADLPIALRSEMDDLYKIIYELRKQVKKLESQMKEKQA